MNQQNPFADPFTYLEAPLSLFLETSALMLSPYVKMNPPYGKGECILLIPGYAETDAHLNLLRSALRLHGYNADTWGIGTNTADLFENIHQLMQRVIREFKTTGKKVHLVGHSLGGIYALYLAHVIPHEVASIVTMGSPLNIDCKVITNQRLRSVFRPPLIPTMTITAKGDTIFGKDSCVFPQKYAETKTLDTVITIGTHCGHVISLATFTAILHHLAHVHSPQRFIPAQYFHAPLANCLYA